MKNQKKLMQMIGILLITIQLLIPAISLYFCKPIGRIEIFINYMFCLPSITLSLYICFMVITNQDLENFRVRVKKYQAKKPIAYLAIISVWGLGLSAILVSIKSNHPFASLNVSTGILNIFLYSIGFISWILSLSLLIAEKLDKNLLLTSINGPYTGKNLDKAFSHYSQKRMFRESDLAFRKRVFTELIIQKRSEESKRLLICILLNVRDISSLPEDTVDMAIPMFTDPPSVRDIDFLLSKVTF